MPEKTILARTKYGQNGVFYDLRTDFGSEVDLDILAAAEIAEELLRTRYELLDGHFEVQDTAPDDFQECPRWEDFKHSDVSGGLTVNDVVITASVPVEGGIYLRAPNLEKPVIIKANSTLEINDDIFRKVAYRSAVIGWVNSLPKIGI